MNTDNPIIGKTLIRNFFFGLMQSMADGVRRDGHARQLADFLTVYPVFKGEIDMDRGYDPAKNGVMIRARLLNEMDLDITDWSFEDMTPGKRSFTLTSCSTGEVIGTYRLGEIGHLNGKELPSTMAGEEIRVHWEVPGTDKSGDIPASKLTSETDRADIAADALAELASAEYDGKAIVFTVRGNFSSAKISATLKYAAPTRHLTVYGLDVSGLGEEMCRLTLSGISDPYAVKGCTGSEGFFHFAAKVYWNGEELGEKEFDSEGEGIGITDFEHPIAEGDTVKVVLEIDPAKTDYDQTPVEVVKTI